MTTQRAIRHRKKHSILAIALYVIAAKFCSKRIYIYLRITNIKLPVKALAA